MSSDDDGRPPAMRVYIYFISVANERIGESLHARLAKQTLGCAGARLRSVPGNDQWPYVLEFERAVPAETKARNQAHDRLIASVTRYSRLARFDGYETRLDPPA